MLVVEIDGPIHETEENKSYDAFRTQGFREFDIKVLRFRNKEVLDDIERVIEIIKQALR